MEGTSYEDISPSEGEVTEVPAVLPLLSEQELRRVLEDLQGENSGLELWEGEREFTGAPPNLVQEEEPVASRLVDRELPKSKPDDSEDKKAKLRENEECCSATDQKCEIKEGGVEKAMGRVVNFKDKVEVLEEQRKVDIEAEASKFVKFREKREITTEEETTEEEEEENLVRQSTSGMLLFSTLGGASRDRQQVSSQEEEDGHTSGDGMGPGSCRRRSKQPARKRKRRARREPGDVLKRGDMLEYLVEDGDDETWFKVEVMGKGKAKGKNRNYINLK